MFIRSGLIFIPSGGFYVHPVPSNPFSSTKKKIGQWAQTGLIFIGAQPRKVTKTPFGSTDFLLDFVQCCKV